MTQNVEIMSFQEWLKETHNKTYTEFFKEPISYQQMVNNQYRDYLGFCEGLNGTN